MSDDTPKKNESGAKPTVIQVLPVGHTVCLGELYDQHSEEFLGVQLYPEENLKIAETDIKHTSLTLSLSNSLEEKASKLDISLKVTLSILCGLIKISGSASYVKDVRSNLREQAYALALKMRLKERRILFGEDAMGRNVLDVVLKDYIHKGTATHFVSGIVYGGNLIINLVARQAMLSSSEKLSGSLQWILSGLKGAIKLGAEVDAEKFKGLDDKFDLVVHGDVALEQTPTQPAEVIEAMRSAASLIQKDGGVPISVILQPIPDILLDDNQIYEIDRLLVEQVQKAFALLDDLRSRFAVLIGNTNSFAEFAPELDRTARVVADKYGTEQGLLLYELRNFMDDYQHGKPLPPGFERSKNEEGIEEIPVLKKAFLLYERYIMLDDPSYQPSPYYPSTLVGLENEYLRFQNFVLDMLQLRDTVLTLADSCREFVALSGIDNINKFIRLQSKIPLFVMTSFTSKQPQQSTTRPDPDLATIQFFASLRENNPYFNNSSTPARILYAETTEMLKSGLPNLGKYSEKEGPFFIIGQVVSGEVTWSEPSPIVEVSSSLVHESSAGKSGDFSYDIPGVNGKESFSVQIWAKPSNASSPSGSTFCLFHTKARNTLLDFQIQSLTVKVGRLWKPAAILNTDRNPPSNQVFVTTFVQDLDEEQWFLYLGEEKVAYVYFEPQELLSDATSVKLAFPATDVTWWNGEVLEVRTFSVALSEEQVAAEVKKPGGTAS